MQGNRKNNSRIIHRKNTGLKKSGMKIPDNSMRDHLQKLSEQKFTGDVVFKFHFNQGGIRSSKITLEKVLPLTGEDI